MYYFKCNVIIKEKELIHKSIQFELNSCAKGWFFPFRSRCEYLELFNSSTFNKKNYNHVKVKNTILTLIFIYI